VATRQSSSAFRADELLHIWSDPMAKCGRPWKIPDASRQVSPLGPLHMTLWWTMHFGALGPMVHPWMS